MRQTLSYAFGNMIFNLILYSATNIQRPMHQMKKRLNERYG
jgi:hypothetical protein